MSITRDRGMVVFQCDECREILETETYEFFVAREEMMRKGWKAEKFCADWRHICPDCQ